MVGMETDVTRSENEVPNVSRENVQSARKRKRKTKKDGSVKKIRIEYKKDKDEGSETEVDDIPLAERLRRKQKCSM
ncbi:hypothetical protein A2U01_0063870 [Trifolium medium]|uniref:Uncharacterized protein n=1 Tax=Trifolium medium TaxID=97028 RepID=A0A392S169_9FABA|nr:hypothetical protein [Trifolium medium]